MDSNPTPAPLVERFAQSKAALDAEQTRAAEFRPRPVHIPAPTPLQDAQETYQRLSAELRGTIIAHVVARRATAVREYMHRADALIDAFYDLVATEDLLVSLAPSKTALTIGHFHALLAIPFPLGLAESIGFSPQGAHSRQYVSGGAPDMEAQLRPAAARRTRIEAEVRRAFAGGWPFNNR